MYKCNIVSNELAQNYAVKSAYESMQWPQKKGIMQSIN